MKTIRTTAHVGHDGVLRLEVPTDMRNLDVDVTLFLQPSNASRNWLDTLKDARSSLEECGHVFRTKEDIDAEIDDLRAQM